MSVYRSNALPPPTLPTPDHGHFFVKRAAAFLALIVAPLCCLGWHALAVRLGEAEPLGPLLAPWAPISLALVVAFGILAQRRDARWALAALAPTLATVAAVAVETQRIASRTLATRLAVDSAALSEQIAADLGRAVDLHVVSTLLASMQLTLAAMVFSIRARRSIASTVGAVSFPWPAALAAVGALAAVHFAIAIVPLERPWWGAPSIALVPAAVGVLVLMDVLAVARSAHHGPALRRDACLAASCVACAVWLAALAMRASPTRRCGR